MDLKKEKNPKKSALKPVISHLSYEFQVEFQNKEMVIITGDEENTYFKVKFITTQRLEYYVAEHYKTRKKDCLLLLKL